MIRTASRAGFVYEGRLRRAAWVYGDFADEVILGMLAADWTSGGSRPPGEGGIADARS
jgi:RimJ/RimL family protein N-acetyltransferase